MNWQEAGAGDPIIFIHGFPFNSTMWQEQLAGVPEGWRFIAPDLRGFGQTELGKSALSMDVFADDVVALMDHLALDQAVICGHSMGGYVALSLVTRYPDRVRALVLDATRANGDSDEAKKGRHELAGRARAEGAQPVIDSMLPKLISDHTKMKQPQIEERVREMMASTDPETMARALQGMAARKDYTGELDKIDVATLVIRGMLDEIIPAGDMELIARTVRGARHEPIALSGHMPNLEATEAFNKILIGFLNYLPPALKLGDFNLSF